MTGRLRLPQLPIAGQLMILLVGALLIAQGSTLVLTLIFPPQPPAQHSLDDIARALRGQTVEVEGTRPLQRAVVDVAPRPPGPGWLSAAGPRDQLAGLLDAEPSDVLLMFYVPLPAGTGAAPSLSPDRREAPTGASTGALANADEAQAAPQMEPGSTGVFKATLAPTGEGPPLLIRANYMPSDHRAPFGRRPDLGMGGGDPQPFRSRASARAARRQTQTLRGEPAGDAMPGHRLQATVEDDAPRPFARADSADLPHTLPRGAEASGSGLPFVDVIRPRPDAPGPGEGPSPGPGARIAARALTGVLASRRRADEVSSRLMMELSPATSAPAAPPAPVESTLPGRTTVEAAQLQAPPRVFVAPQSEIQSSPAEATPSTASPGGRAAAPDRPAPSPLAAASSAVRRGLFASAPAGYIEGDFVAAQRIGDRWVVVEPRPETFPTAWQSRVTLWFLLSLALVAPFGWLFARRIVAPLRSFADAAEQLGRDPSAPSLVQGGPAEIGRAASAFNLMQGRLKRYVDDRTAMIGAISHDLRTPLTRMRFRLEAAPAGLKPGLETDIDQMEAMIASVLAFMRDQAEGGSRRRLDLRALLHTAVDNAVAGGADITLEPGDPVEIDADSVALSRVFANLLDNAVKYGGRAVVRVVREGGEVVAAVRDFGPGLPDSELEQVFKPFYRTPDAAASLAPGMGLGLANSRSIVLAHGGAIRLSSQEGLTAEVRLPVAV